MPSECNFIKAANILVTYGEFSWIDFHIPKYYTLRLKTLLDDFVDAKQLIRGHYRPKTWIGFTTVSRIVRAYLQRAIDFGTRSWDITIARCLSLVLVSSLAARAGDVAHSRDFTGDEYMKYRDIELYLEGDDAKFVNLRARVTMRYTKGFKDSMAGNMTCYLQPLGTSHTCHVCPISLLLVHALRHGLVRGSTLQDILTKAAARADRRVVWLFPDRPVLAAFAHSGAHVCLDRPARVDQLRDSIRTIGLAGGVLDRIYVHATRLGAARDMAHLPEAALDGHGFNVDAVRQRLGHSHWAMQSGVTEAYIGGPSLDAWKASADNPKRHHREPAFAKDPAAAYQYVYKPVSEEEILSILGRPGTEAEHFRVQNQVREQRRRELRDAVLAEPPSSLVGLIDDSPLPFKVTNQTEEDLERVDVPEIDIENLQSTLFSRPATQDHSAKRPELTAYSLISSNSEDHEAAMSAADDGEQEETARLLTEDDREDGQVTPESWIESYAKVNIVYTGEFGTLWRKHCLGQPQLDKAKSDRIFDQVCSQGHSRDGPQPFMVKCRKTAGCSYESIHGKDMTVHELICDEERVQDQNAAAAQLTAPGGKVYCPRQGCTFSTLASKNPNNAADHISLHIKDKHDFLHKPCEHGCEPGRVYTTLTAYKAHQNGYHNDRWPVECSFPGCTNSTQFRDLGNLKKHLRRTHNLENGNMAPYIPSRTPVIRWAAQTCVDDDYESRAVFKSKKDMVSHLTTGYHKLTRKDAHARIGTLGHHTETVTPKAVTRKGGVTVKQAEAAAKRQKMA